MFFGIETKYEALKEFGEMPFIGIIIFLLILFFPAILLSILLQHVFPSLDNEAGFDKAFLILLPPTNYFMWRKEIKAYIFFIPSWALFLFISTYNAIMNY